jgi:hypothetical protein
VLFRSNDHDRTRFALLETAGGDYLHVESAVENFLFKILQEAVGLFVADAFGISFHPETLANKDLFFRGSHVTFSFY